MLAIRITEPYDAIAEMWKKLEAQSEKLIVYEHTGGRVHCHAHVEGCQVSTDTLKNWVKKALNVTAYPKQNWSFKGSDGNDRYIMYMSKGKFFPKLLKGYHPDEVDVLRQQWVEPLPKVRTGELTQYKLKTENPKEAKARQNELMDQVVQRLREKGTYTGRDVLETIRQVVVVEHRTVIGRYKMRDFYDYVMLRTDSQKFMDSMENFCCFRT